jgi:hypothetical protein
MRHERLASVRFNCTANGTAASLSDAGAEDLPASGNSQSLQGYDEHGIDLQRAYQMVS